MHVETRETQARGPKKDRLPLETQKNSTPIFSSMAVLRCLLLCFHPLLRLVFLLFSPLLYFYFDKIWPTQHLCSPLSCPLPLSPRKTTGFVTMLWGFLLGRCDEFFSSPFSQSSSPQFFPPPPAGDRIWNLDKEKRNLVHLLLCHHQEGGQ